MADVKILDLSDITIDQRRELQEGINARGGNIAVDGMVGPNTIGALQKIFEDNDIDYSEGMTFDEALTKLTDVDIKREIEVSTKGASELDQKQLQLMILARNPDALPLHGADGGFGGEGRGALQALLEENNIEYNDEMTVREAIDLVATIPAPAADVSTEPLSKNTSREDVKKIQVLLNVIDPKLMPKKDIDGVVGNQVLGALRELSPHIPDVIGIDLATASVDDIITNLQNQISMLPERYIVDDCDTMSEIAVEVYGDEIKAYTQELMASDFPEFKGNKKLSEQRAIQMATARIAFANNKGEGHDASVIHKGDVFVIPDAGPLKSSDPNLDWAAHDAKREEVLANGGGGPCDCDGPITGVFTDASTPQNSVNSDGKKLTELPSKIDFGGTCVATLEGTSKKYFDLWGDVNPHYVITGIADRDEKIGYHDVQAELRRIMNDDSIVINSGGQCGIIKQDSSDSISAGNAGTGTEGPGTGTEGPGTEGPGTEGPGTEGPGTDTVGGDGNAAQSTPNNAGAGHNGPDVGVGGPGNAG